MFDVSQVYNPLASIPETWQKNCGFEGQDRKDGVF